MGKSSSQAPQPDPNIGKAAVMQAKTGEDWLAFAKDAFKVSNERQADLDAITKQVSDLQIGIGKQTLEQAQSDRARWETQFKPLEDEFVSEAKSYASPERQQAAAAEAKADILSAADQQRQTADRQALAMGINPTSGAYAGLQRGTAMGTALASAGGQNAARSQVRDKGLALKADAINLGRGALSTASAGLSQGTGIQSNAVGLVGNANAQYVASTDIMNTGYKGAMTGYAGMGSTLNQQYATQVQAWGIQKQAEAQEAAGIASAFGGILGLFASDRKVKKDMKKLPDGFGLKAVKSMPVEEWTYKDGAGDGGRHIGTYAQDFRKATGQGDGKTIPIIDAIGVTMAAVKDLDAKVQRLAIGISRKPASRQRFAPMKEAA